MPRGKGAFRVQFEFKSVTQIQRLMEGMDIRDQTKVLESALETASKPIVEASRQNILSAGASKPFGGRPAGKALYRTGALYKSMGFIVRRYLKTGKLVAYIGARHISYAGNIPEGTSVVIRDTRPLKQEETKVVPSKYIHLVHEGFFNKLTGKRVEGKPFLKDAFDANIAQAEWTLLSGCATALEKVWNRNVARLARATFKKAA